MASLWDLLNGTNATPGPGPGPVRVAAPLKPRSKVPQPRVSKAVLTSRKLVQIAVRRKLPLKRLQKQEGLKLHLKLLEAGLRFKLTMAPLLEALYGLLTPRTNRKGVASEILVDEPSGDVVSKLVFLQNHLHDSPLVSKLVQVIDNNLVDLAGVSNKVLQTFHLHRNVPGTISAAASDTPLPTFNSLDTAILSLFGVREYLLVRVTRSTTGDSEGSTLLKLETAAPGDMALLDDPEYADEMIHSIGAPGQTPSNLFMKKIVARPRYKSDMKIYFVPQRSQLTLYVDPRALERDLLHGMIDSCSSSDRKILTNFKAEKVLAEFHELVKQSEQDERSRKQKTTSVAVKKEPKTTGSSLGESIFESNSGLLKLSSNSPPYTEATIPLAPRSENLLPLGFSEKLSVFNRPKVMSEYSSEHLLLASRSQRPELSVSSVSGSFNGAFPPSLNTQDSFVRSLDYKRSTPLPQISPADSLRSRTDSGPSISSFSPLAPQLDNSAFLRSNSLMLSGDLLPARSTPILPRDSSRSSSQLLRMPAGYSEPSLPSTGRSSTLNDSSRSTPMRLLPSIGSLTSSNGARDGASLGGTLPSLVGSVSSTGPSLPSLVSNGSSSSSRASNNSSRGSISEPVDYFESAKRKLSGLREAVAEDEGSLTQVYPEDDQPPALEHYFGRGKTAFETIELNPNLDKSIPS